MGLAKAKSAFRMCRNERDLPPAAVKVETAIASKWFVQDHHKRDAKPGEFCISQRAGLHGDGQREAVQQRMKRQAQRGADPGKLPGGFVRQCVRMFLMLMRMTVIVVMVMVMVVTTAILGVALRQIVMMKMKEALDEEHHQEATREPLGGLIHGMQIGHRHQEGNGATRCPA